MGVQQIDRLRPDTYLDEFPYTGPDRLAGKYMRLFWQPVARSEDLPAGKAKPIKVMNVDYTLYRGQSGTPYVVDHRCAHRGTQLSVGFVEGEEIRCLYHGWKFRADGQCTERPGELGKSGAGIRIGAYPTQEFLGLIYAYLGEGEPPAFPPYPAFEGEGFIEAYATVFPVNYFQGWENDWDAYHARYTHMTGELHEFDYDATLASERYEEHDYGCTRTMDIGGGRINRSILLMPATTQLLIPTFNGQVGGTGPTARVTYIAHVPIDDHSHWAYVTNLARVPPEHADAYLARREEFLKVNASCLHPASVAAEILKNGIASVRDTKGHPMLVEVEDQLAQGGQGAIVDRRAEHLGRTDAGIVMLRRIFAREMHAVAEGRPNKQWTMAPLIPEDGWYI
jgi:5,5'-dehydrodivanillate O-demethylase